MWIPTQSQWAFCSFSTYFLGKKGNFIVKPIQFLYFGVGLWDVFFLLHCKSLQTTRYKLQMICVVCLYITYHPRLFNQVGHQDTAPNIENEHFFSLNHVRPIKIMNNLLIVCKICTFKVIFWHQKSTESFWFFFLWRMFDKEISALINEIWDH